MRISRIIVALLVSVVAVTAMTGVAVANPSTTASPDNVDVDISTNAPTTITITHTIQAGDCLADGIYFRLYRIDPLVAGVTNELTGSWDGTTYVGGEGGLNSATLIGNVYTWTFDVKDAIDTDDTAQIGYTYKASFSVSNTTQGTLGSIDAQIGASSTTIDPIPEFATIAIPAIAVLGLFLFFNKRKHKKD